MIQSRHNTLRLYDLIQTETVWSLVSLTVNFTVLSYDFPTNRHQSAFRYRCYHGRVKVRLHREEEGTLDFDPTVQTHPNTHTHIHPSIQVTEGMKRGKGRKHARPPARYMAWSTRLQDSIKPSSLFQTNTHKNSSTSRTCSRCVIKGMAISRHRADGKHLPEEGAGAEGKTHSGSCSARVCVYVLMGERTPLQPRKPWRGASTHKDRP